jgi:hypothetical protein
MQAQCRDFHWRKNCGSVLVSKGLFAGKEIPVFAVIQSSQPQFFLLTTESIDSISGIDIHVKYFP